MNQSPFNPYRTKRGRIPYDASWRQRYVTVGDIADHLHVSINVVYSWIRRGRIDIRKAERGNSRKLYFPRTYIDQWIRENVAEIGT